MLSDLLTLNLTLDDHVVGFVDVELDFGSGVAVRQSQLCFVAGHSRETFDEFGKVLPDSTDNLGNDSNVGAFNVASIVYAS